MRDTSHVFLASQAIHLAFGDRVKLNHAELVQAVEGDERVLAPALHFLIERDEIIATIDTDSYLHRENLIRKVLAQLADREIQSIVKVAEKLGVDAGPLAEILGWLERDGRVLQVDTDFDEEMKFQLR